MIPGYSQLEKLPTPCPPAPRPGGDGETGPQYMRLAAAQEMEKPPTLRSWAPVPVAGCGLGDREATHPVDLGTSNCGWLWPGRQRSRSPCGPDASTCSWLQHGRWRIRPPCSPGHQHLWLAVAWETEKPPTLQSWAPALAAAAQAKPPVHHPLRLQPAWAPMADQREGSLDPGCLWSAGGGNPGYQRHETTEKSHPVPENSEANEAPKGPAQDSDQGSQGADPIDQILGLASQHGPQTPVPAPTSNKETETGPAPKQEKPTLLDVLKEKKNNKKRLNILMNACPCPPVKVPELSKEIVSLVSIQTEEEANEIEADGDIEEFLLQEKRNKSEDQTSSTENEGARRNDAS
ncbi:hypothetical protein QTO34_014160 [Cnephaeus nilssonii]|uniref:Uncharacterized protein n=1 Tax=Cnephaeus nilssonii TaxID=3371016 RepID=A0AA40HA35_CNENI|nr:hypothetical protein QTO34_014160 [Eptesicus nilssonii]